MTNFPEENGQINPLVSEPSPDELAFMREVQPLFAALSDEERESALRILRPSEENEEATPTVETGDTEETR